MHKIHGTLAWDFAGFIFCYFTILIMRPSSRKHKFPSLNKIPLLRIYNNNNKISIARKMSEEKGKKLFNDRYKFN